MNNINAIFFDFDGVIADSVHIKTEAFSHLYKHYGKKVVNQVVSHHLANGGMSRFEKFKLYHKDFLGIDLDGQQIQVLSKKFSDLVIQKVVAAPFISGALEFIDNIYINLPLYVISATPQDEINDIVLRKKIRKYFKGIYGSPTSKSEWIKFILGSNNYDPQKVVFIGDAINDYRAAMDGKIRFVGIVNNTEKNIFIGKNVDFIINNFIELENILAA